MENDDEPKTATQAVGYIAGVGFGIARSVLRGHFVVLVLVTIALLVSLFFIETELSLVRVLIVYAALIAFIFGHALLRKPAA